MKFRFLLLTLAFLALLASVAAPALAHGELLRSVPEANAVLNRPPAQIELYFSEALEASFSSIKVFDSTGAQVDTGDSRLDPTDPTRLRVSLRSLPDGVYTVSWQVLSAVDGHVTAGAFPFAIGDVDASALAAAEQASRTVKLLPGEIVARWLTYLSIAALTGGLLFVLAIWQPATQVEADDIGYRALWRRLALLALLSLALAQILALLVQAGQAIGAAIAAPWSPAVGQILFTTRYGALWLARLALALALVGLLPATPRTRWFAVGVALLLPLTISLGSHAAAEAKPLLPVLADWVHLLATSAWVGGLIYFVAGLWATRQLDPALRTRLTAWLIPRFSALALLSVGVLSLTGLYSTILRIGTFEALTSTWYGRTLLIKLIMVLPMALLGAVNLFNTRPALKRAAVQAEGNISLLARFRRLVGGEITLGVAVLLSVGVLTALPPPQLTSTLPALDFSTEVDDLSLKLNITPGRVGLNTFTVSLRSGDQPVEQAKEVALRFTPTTANIPPSEAQLIEQGNGQYAIKGSYLSLPDAWQVQAVVRREGKFDAFANFTVDISPTAATLTYSWPQVNGTLLLITAAAYAFAVRGLSRTWPQWLAWGVAPALALVWVGLTLFFRPPTNAEAGPVNPIPPNTASLSTGQALYERHCLSCHGPTGLGDGPVGLTLNPRPADLTQHTIPGVHPDSQLYEWISDGFPGSVMPAFRATLTDEERWHLVNYIRTLAFATKESTGLD